ncbi:MAG TPA: CapA family protein [Bacilli bacterium]|nr:CapA family protein [Bacilli bacterium]
MKKRKKIKKGPIIITFLILIILVFGCLYVFKEYFEKNLNNESPTELNKEDEPTTYTASLTIAGNILVNSNMWYDTLTVDGDYDFEYVFEDLKSEIKTSAVNLYSQQSILGGEDLGKSSYYNYNSPYEEAGAMIDMGFNMVSLGSYQAYDKELDGITNTLNYFNENNIVNAGISDSEEDRLSNNIVTKNSIRYGLLSYTMGTDETFDEDYLIDIYSDDLVKSDVEAIQDDVDIIIVSIDWSNIDSADVTDEQREIATYLSELGVNVVVGNTGYIIQPIEVIDNTIVFYSLGNLLSGHSTINERISAIVDFDIIITESDDIKTLEFTNINILLTYAYNQYSTNYKVLPFTTITDELSSYETYYDKYSEILKTNDDSINIYELGE